MVGAVLLLLVLVPGALVLALATAGRQLSRPPAGPLAVLDRTTRRWRTAGLLAGLVAAVASLRLLTLGLGPLLAAPLLALGLLLGTVVGELGVAAPSGAVRSAPLQTRRVRDQVPAGLAAGTSAATGVLAVVLTLTTLLGSPDDLGRNGRVLARQCTSLTFGSRGPWPGSWYAAPLTAVLLVGLVTAGIALRRVVRRPWQAADPTADDLLRRRAATTVVAAVGLLVTVPLVAVGVIAVPALLTLCSSAWSYRAGGVVLLLLLLPAVALGARCALELALPGRTEPAGARV